MRYAISLFLVKTPHRDFSHAHFTVGRRWLLFISALPGDVTPRAMENYHHRRAGFFNTRWSSPKLLLCFVITGSLKTHLWIDTGKKYAQYDMGGLCLAQHIGLKTHTHTHTHARAHARTHARTRARTRTYNITH